MTDCVRYDRLILLMDDEELEKFCRAWTEKKTGYVEVKRIGTTGDMGRDVVGFLTDKRHEGAWDNYQCKQYRKGVSRSQGLLAIGKVLYWASQGHFTPPRNFFFTAPKGLARKLELLIDKPSELKKALIDEWDSVCANSITKKALVPMDAKIKAVIDAYDFKNVRTVTIDDMMDDPAVKPLLIEKFGADPGQYPPATVPTDVQGAEMRYVEELVVAYGERAEMAFADHDAVLADADHGPDLRRQRERFFEAEAFQKFYREMGIPFTDPAECATESTWTAICTPWQAWTTRAPSKKWISGFATRRRAALTYGACAGRMGLCARTAA